MLAAKKEHVEIVKFLFIQGAEVDTANSKGLTALHYATKRGQWFSRLLLAHFYLVML